MKQIDLLLGQRLKHERIMSNLTQGELGKRLGVSAQQVQKYEMGINRVSVSRFLEISAILKCDPKALVADLAKNKTKRRSLSMEESREAFIDESITKVFSKIKKPSDRRLLLDLGKRLAR